MQRTLQPFSNRIYGLVRIVVGFLYACHGADKLWGAFGGSPHEFGLSWVAGVIELLGGGMICVGLFTGWVAFICSGEMAVAYFMAHQPRAWFPIQNRGELAAVYSWIFLYIAARGAGPWALGSIIGAGRAAPAGKSTS